MFTRVFADGPAALGEITLAGFDRRAFKLRRHRVVEAVEKAEQRDHRDDIDNLCLAVVLLQLYEIRFYHRSGDLYGTLRDPERGALGGGEERVAQRSLRRQTPKVGAVCGKAARTDLCGGRPVMDVPTAITARPGLEFPKRIFLVRSNADAFGRVRGVRHAIAATGGAARHLRDQIPKLWIDLRARPVDRCTQLAEGAQDLRAPRHDQLRVWEKPHPAL